MKTEDLKKLIERSATEIARLNERVDETVRYRDRTPKDRDLWKQACAEFYSRFDALSFPGGFDGAATRIIAGDPYTVEAALCFLELRPYFFRSGYMHKELLRKTKRAPLSQEQASRLQAVQERQALWHAKKKSSNVA